MATVVKRPAQRSLIAIGKLAQEMFYALAPEGATLTEKQADEIYHIRRLLKHLVTEYEYERNRVDG